MKHGSDPLNMTRLSGPFNSLLTLTIILSVAMVTLGGLVHNTDSSLACPDWPLCFGQLMPEMKGGVLIEHSHRILGTLIGLLVMGLCALSWSLPFFRRRSLVALGLVILQGLFGGATVLLRISPLVSTLHLALSQIFLAWLVCLKVDACPASSSTYDPASYTQLHAKYGLMKFALGALFFQMVLGASMRHGGAGVACGVGPEASVLCLDSLSGSASFWPTGLAAKVNWLHRLFALVATGFVIAGTLPVIKFGRLNGVKGLRLVAVFCHILVCAQIGLGVASLWTGIGVIPTTLHLLVACLLWISLVGLLRYTQNTFEAPGPFTIAAENSKRISIQR